ncbi:oxygen-insensitive NADPH nitroreductase [Radiobacillus kanasensis]|uniref:oxygen-insensitive NADPH nitroreductase n=1 Tax=Radiobacillus kanasensis TaxID=2844358 RepID=UPI001E336DCB|nr:oxygen-insensitive NADPH nitroreductase [Radiobacillus kanasensis]UFU00852.1 oxygen-insensitive NADPH nitroreductase [Radiobacillus kanasensis]
MNETIQTILGHRSIRKFKDRPLSEEEISVIVEAASRASTSSFMMAYSIIGVDDLDIKTQLAQVSGQPYVEQNGHLFVFCADLNKVSHLSSPEEKQLIEENLENTEHFLVSTIDAALAAQNACLAAEAIGLGAVFIGSLRNNIEKVDRLLELPKHVIPLFGLAVGEPNHDPQLKPRFPMEAYYFKNKYTDASSLTNVIEQFDDEVKDYYKNRPANKRLDEWSNQMIRKLSSPIRTDVTPFVQSKGFNKR